MNGRNSNRAGHCRAAVFSGAGQPLEIEQFTLPETGPYEALVRINCCTICGSDLHTINGTRNEPIPSILGHEIVGTIFELGSPVSRDCYGHLLRQGDRVTWSICVSCRECDRCNNGLPQKCRKLAKYGHEIAEGRQALSGGLADFVLLRKGTSIIKVDSNIPDEVICPANCATATVAAAFRASRNVKGKTVLILGAGMLGLTAAAFAKTRQAANVVVCDTNPDRLTLARSFGANQSLEWNNDYDLLSQHISTVTGNTEVDVIFEFSGSPDAVEAACHIAGVGTHVILVGSVMGTRPVRINPESVVRNCLCISGVHNYVPQDLQTAVDFLAQCHSSFPFAELVHKSYALNSVNEAIQDAIRTRPIRVAVRPGDIHDSHD